jgi:tight adherence protein B
MDFLYYAFITLLFIAVALATEAGWNYWFSSQSEAARRLRRRLQEVRSPSSEAQANNTSLLKDNRLSQSVQVDAMLRRLPGILRLHEFLQQAGLSWTVAGFLSFTTLAFLSAFVLGLLLGAPVSVLLPSVLIFTSLPSLFVSRQRSQRLRQIELQLPEAADLISRSLRAGHALPSTLLMLADEMPNPIAAEFRIVADEVNFGLSMVDALQRLARRIPLPDVQYMVIAVLIQREAGGNLSELMSVVSRLVRLRIKLMGDVRVLSAEGRLSAWILCLLPVGVVGLFSLTSPEYLKHFLSDPDGPAMLSIAAVMMLLGVLWMRSIVSIRT